MKNNSPQAPLRTMGIVVLFVSFLACSFLVSGNMQKCKNSLLGVNFEQLLGQEAPTSCLIA